MVEWVVGVNHLLHALGDRRYVIQTHTAVPRGAGGADHLQPARSVLGPFDDAAEETFDRVVKVPVFPIDRIDARLQDMIPLGRDLEFAKRGAGRDPALNVFYLIDGRDVLGGEGRESREPQEVDAAEAVEGGFVFPRDLPEV